MIRTGIVAKRLNKELGGSGIDYIIFSDLFEGRMIVLLRTRSDILPISAYSCSHSDHIQHLWNTAFSHRFLQTIENCMEKVGRLKIWEPLKESGREGGNNFCYIRTDSLLCVTILLLILYFDLSK